MNHRYIFRGKGNPKYNDGEWYYGHLIYDGSDYQIVDPEYGSCKRTVIPETVGQSTGLKDKNGKLIFEGDIIITDKFNTPEIRYTIVYDKEIATFIGEYKKGYVKHFTTFEGDSNCFEVIGNIHDNPDEPADLKGSKSTCLNGWISVKDRLPEDYKDVLAYDSGHKEIVIAFYDSESEEWTYGNWYDGEITYWQPLPELLEVER